LIRIEQHKYRRAHQNTRWISWLVGLGIVLCAVLSGAGSAGAETRSLKLYFTHTGEKAEIVFKRNGRYDQAGLRRISQIVRDWRRNEPTRMDPRLIDLVWSVYRSVGARDYIHVVSGYRSPATNSMLRSRSKGVARKSQHMLGRARDFFIPVVSLRRLREAGMKMQIGGVGYYPRSGSPFVHMDVGNVRHWPRMSRRELVAIFPNGKTLHVPSDGKPLPGFEQAVASYQARKKNGTVAMALAGSGGSRPSKGLLAALFGGGEDEDEEGAAPAPAAKIERAKPQVMTAAKQEAKPEAKQVAKPEAKPAPERKAPGIQIVSPQDANRAELPVAAKPEGPGEETPLTPEAIIASLPMRAIPLPAHAPRSNDEAGIADMATASVTETPAAVPFGMPQPPPPELAGQPLDAEAGQPAEMAFNVPLPTPRPDLGKSDAASKPQDEILLALASADRDTMTASDAAAVPLPFGRPANGPEMDMAAATEQQGLSEDPRSADKRAAIAAAIKANNARVAALADNVVSGQGRTVAAGVDSRPVASPGVKTTRKTARATAGDARPDRKVRVKAAEPRAARWVLGKDYVTNVTQSTTAPSFAYNAVVTAPQAVYTAGFKKGGEATPDINRFSGKAVEFLSVARFE
jgi:uncharacterized protein YcbK (DUF882 family)